MLRIATWNINSIRQRLEIAQEWLKERQPDIVCLQEIKCLDEAFPAGPFEDLGYNVAIHGQKTFNGVAVLSKKPFDDIAIRLPGNEEDEQARYIESVVSVPSGVVRIGGLYLPNGNPVDSDKYPYKLRWMDHLIIHARDRLRLEEPFLLIGDYNVIPTAADCADETQWIGDALYLPQTRAKFRELLSLGFTDALRAVQEGQGPYTFWDYQAGAWQRNNGIRIDHILLSPQAADRLVCVGIDKDMRAKDKPSDHVPVWCDLDL